MGWPTFVPRGNSVGPPCSGMGTGEPPRGGSPSRWRCDRPTERCCHGRAGQADTTIVGSPLQRGGLPSSAAMEGMEGPRREHEGEQTR